MNNYLWMSPADRLDIEIIQAKEEGRDLSAVMEEIEAVRKLPPGAPREEKATQLYQVIAELPADNGYYEPSDYESILAARPGGEDIPFSQMELSNEELYDRVYGGWLGRASGCLLGKPVEGWKRARIKNFNRVIGNDPVTRYMSTEGINAYTLQQLAISPQAPFIDRVSCMPEDDDTNYTVLGLCILKNHGRNFTAEDVAERWLSDLPLLHLCTAERVAYINLANRIVPPACASYANPYREWIGAQIRADFFGYINPGDPQSAADMCYRDASISHVRNGIYGEMLCGAMIAAAFSTRDLVQIVEAGMQQIPCRSRLYERLQMILDWKREGITASQAMARIHSLYDEYSEHDWCHTISNAMIVAASLLFGEGDFGKSISMAVMAGFDTDCNGATVGSILGVRAGAKMLPEEWVGPLNDSLRSGVDGYGLVKISDLAADTMRFLP